MIRQGIELLEIKDCVLVVVDVQGRLAELMDGREKLFENIRIMIKAAGILDIPVIWCQQCPEALGETVPQIKELLGGSEPVNKASFSCCGEDSFNAALGRTGRRSVLLCGIEAHICIYQTAADLSRRGSHVTVIADAVSSRRPENRQLAVERMAAMGVNIGSAEMMLFELLKTAKHPKFRDIAKLVK